LIRLEVRFEAFLEEMRAFREEVRSRLDRMETRQDSYFRWVMGTILIMWASVIAVVLGALIAG
jgi:hypothetical protein